LSDGTTVNANIYDLRSDVYLNGGPQNQNSAGLPNGIYLFQVTDPSGATLLSTDNAFNRQLQVVNGRVFGTPGTTLGPGNVVSPSVPPYHVNGSYNVANMSISVQLAPFNFTPNPGGEYKAWLIRWEDTNGSPILDSNGNPITTIDTTDPKIIHFTNDNAKTDNFKVREQPPGPGPTVFAIAGEKYYDVNANGVKDGGEVGVPNFKIHVTYVLPNGGGSGAMDTYTNANGDWSLIFPTGTTYTACEVLPNTMWVQTGPLDGVMVSAGTSTATASALCWSGTVGNSDLMGLDFGNVCLGAGGGLTLGFWSNKNGQNIMKGTDNFASDLAFLRSLNLRNADGSNFDPTTYDQFRTWLLGASATNMAYMLSAQLVAMELNVRHGFVSSSVLVYAPGCGNTGYGNNFISIADLMTKANNELGLHGHTTSDDSMQSSFRSFQECLKNALDKANNNMTFVQATPCPFDYPY
jgi:hypothetical protein